MQKQDARNELEIANETLVMTYLNFLKYAEHHCNANQDPLDVTDHIFYVWYKVACETNVDEQEQ